MELEFLDFSGLTLYDSLIKQYIDEGDADSISAITSQEERLLGIEDSISGLTKTSNKLRGRIEKILVTLDEGVAIIDQLSGETYYVTDVPTEDDEHALVKSEGIWRLVKTRVGYVECSDVGRTGDPNIKLTGATVNGYDLMGGGGFMRIKMSTALHTAEYTYLEINDTGNFRLYFNGKPANQDNTWDDGETIAVWFDGAYYQSTHAFGVAKASEIMYDSATTLTQKITQMDTNLSTLSANTKNAIDDLSGKTNTAINNLSAATNTAISNLSSATSNAISALSSATHSELERVEGKVDVNSAAINALSLGAKTTTSVSPGCIYKGEAANVTVTATFTPNDLKPSEIYLREDSASGTILASGTNVNTVSKVQPYTLNTNSKNFVSTAKYEGAQFMHSAALQARYPIYCGFCNTNGTTPVYTDITNTSHRLSARTSAAGKYTATATGANQKYCILVPSDIGALSTFTMGGAPVDMVSTTTTVGTVEYKAYYTNALYIAGGYVDITAS